MTLRGQITEDENQDRMKRAQESGPSTSNFAMISPSARTMKPFDINNINVVDLTGDSDEEDTMNADMLLDMFGVSGPEITATSTLDMIEESQTLNQAWICYSDLDLCG
ncbi:uncharacterized protein CIMG_13227 [Coccidioides immitis RS]|uniref:Uncharacterized protein n=1 Tax=Coccidioides immitis (strain RS) TaxID=246410 RepID=A0A0D8JU20_COCIM|nr:uncharacterized protein CIMG_13227 [Coccidioides immitis RS]KJF60787.1 hypothetical protein CIMG_13227 [Coccidioides immitis RS]